MLECVVNVSEGRDAERVAEVAAAAGDHLLDLHSDPHHNRSVLTLVGEEATRAVATAAVAVIDLRRHVGVHPRLGAVDVVPFVALAGSTPADALRARDRTASWLATELAVPCFLYGPERSLPEVRRSAFRSLPPDVGPRSPHPTAGATAVGARPPLVAYNVWLADGGVDLARAVAGEVRSATLRTLGLQVGERAQVSMNLVEPAVTGPEQAYDAVTRAVEARGGVVAGAELVGLVPAAVLRACTPSRWAELDLDPERTIEARLAAAGLG
ncbi:MAG: glutamate formiminotransferase [Acidimicrobiia bacterium]